MSQVKKSIRLKYFIKSGIQLKFLRVNLLLVILITLAVALPVYQLSINILGSSLEEVYPPGLLKDIYKSLNSAFGVRLLFIMLIVIIATFLITHRVAGPAYHIECDLAKMTEGDLTKRIYLRKHDELKLIADKVNKMADRFSQSLNSIQKNVETMEKLYQELRHNELDLSKRQDILERLATSIKGTRDILSQFRIK